MEIEGFIVTLKGLTAAEIVDLAGRIEYQSESAAGELAWWSATVGIERLVRLHRIGQKATASACRAASAVQAAADRGGLESSDPRVLAVARAAAMVARGMASGGRQHVGQLLRAWTYAPVAA